MRSLPIPKTKFRPPALRQPIVPRPRLTDAFSEACPLTVVSAPAGSGKTTLVLEWLASSKRRVAWLSLDSDDNDPVRFIRGCLAAFQTVGETLQIPAGQQDLRSLMAEIINQLGDIEPLTLVLDDYHLIADDSIHSALAYLLEHMPVSLRLVLVTREQTSLPVARLRVRHQARELSLDDLRFNPEETADFLNEVMGLSLPVEQVRSLEQITKGWVAGLQMAGLSLQSNKPGTIPFESDHFPAQWDPKLGIHVT